MEALKVILDSSLPSVIKEMLSTDDVTRPEFQSDCCVCSVEIRNRKSLKSEREGGGRTGRRSNSVGRGRRSRLKTGQREEATCGGRSRRWTLRMQWLIRWEDDEAVTRQLSCVLLFPVYGGEVWRAERPTSFLFRSFGEWKLLLNLQDKRSLWRGPVRWLRAEIAFT